MLEILAKPTRDLLEILESRMAGLSYSTEIFY